MSTPLCRCLVAALLLLSAFPLAAENDGNWPSFRGPGAVGVAEGHSTLTSWDVPKGEGVLWKSPIPGLGHSSPSIWDNLLFVTTAVGAAEASDVKIGYYGDPMPADDNGPQVYRVYALDKTTGEIVWETTAYEGTPKVKRHLKSSHANPTVALDGQHVVAFFGSEGLYTYDMQGKLLWKKDFGVLKSAAFNFPVAEWGFAASPIIHDGRVIIQADVLGDSFLTVLDVRDGREIWRKKREDFPTWSTPTVIPRGDGLQIVVNGFKHMGGYDYETGAELWTMSGGGDVPIPTPFTAHGLIYISNAHGSRAPVYAVRQSAKGDVSLYGEENSNEHVAWRAPRIASYQNTPVVYGNEIYICRDNGGRVHVLDALTGEEHYKERLDGQNFVASPVAADGKVYFSAEEGDVYVVKAGKSYELLATNPMGEITMATPAISEGVIYYRTRFHVVALGKGSEPAKAPATKAGAP